jgi:restriction endonuclease S subunit
MGAVFDSLNCSDIPKFDVRVPPIAEQRAIADVLAALDDKIESNRRIFVICRELTRLELDPRRSTAGPTFPFRRSLAHPC